MKIGKFTSLRSILLGANVIVFCALAVLSILPTEGSFLGRLIFSLTAIFAIFIFPGIHLSILLAQCFPKKQFSPKEIFAIAPVLSLTALPFLLLIEYEGLGITLPYLPLINAIVISSASILFLINPVSIFGKKNTALLDDQKRSMQTLAPPIAIIAIIFYGLITWNITGAFYALPDLDPYYWLTSSRELFDQNKLPSLSEYRPAFAALVYLFTQGASVDFYAFFKYLLPAFFILLIPAFTLVAKQFTSPLQKASIFLFPFVNGVTFLYLTESIPQSIVSILIFFAIAFLAYSLLAHNQTFFVLAGIPIFFGYFYHEVAAIPLIIWLLVLIITFRRNILQYIRANKLSFILIIFILLPYIKIPLGFFSDRREMLLNLFAHIQPNFLFPQHYTNIDGNAMGWGDLLGVTKYYLFYAGPTVVLLLLVGVLFLKQYGSRQKIRTMISQPEILVATLSFGVFFAIAELLPRFADIALLPERAWIFAAPYLLIFLVPLFKTPLGKNTLFLWVLVASLLINIGGASYVNTLKKYVITDSQLASTKWIRNNLPSDRIFFTFSNQKLLSFYSSSKTISITDPNFYFDQKSFEAEFSKYQNKRQILPFDLYQQQLQKTSEKLQTLPLENSPEKITRAASLLAIEIENLKKIQNDLATPINEPRKNHFYIYYAAPNDKNPYLNRPYVKSTPTTGNHFIFDEFPTQFRKIYSDKQERIFIWEIL